MARKSPTYPVIPPITIVLTPIKSEANNIERLIKLFDMDSPKQLTEAGIDLLVTLVKEFREGYELAFYNEATGEIKVLENYAPLEAARRNLTRDKGAAALD